MCRIIVLSRLGASLLKLPPHSLSLSLGTVAATAILIAWLAIGAFGLLRKASAVGAVAPLPTPLAVIAVPTATVTSPQQAMLGQVRYIMPFLDAAKKDCPSSKPLLAL